MTLWNGRQRLGASAANAGAENAPSARSSAALMMRRSQDARQSGSDDHSNHGMHDMVDKDEFCLLCDLQRGPQFALNDRGSWVIMDPDQASRRQSTSGTSASANMSGEEKGEKPKPSGPPPAVGFWDKSLAPTRKHVFTGWGKTGERNNPLVMRHAMLTNL